VLAVCHVKTAAVIAYQRLPAVVDRIGNCRSVYLLLKLERQDNENGGGRRWECTKPNGCFFFLLISLANQIELPICGVTPRFCARIGKANLREEDSK
jgi:hypothetical protein